MALRNCIQLGSCRLCQQETGTISLENSDSLIQIIFTVSKIKIKNDLFDFLPQSICLTCCNKLEDIRIYTKMIQAVDEHLHVMGRKQCDGIYWTPVIENLSDVEDNINKWKCMDCPATFDDDFCLSEHIKSHKITNSITSDQFTCPICRRIFRRESSYEIHKKNHPELHCDKCDSTFNFESELKTHTCSNLEIISREICQSKPKGGIESKNKDEDKTSYSNYRCSICEEQFLDKNSLRIHSKQHKHCSRNHTCSINGCLKIFRSLYALKRHKLTHEGKKTLLCVTCGKSFLTKSSLICHEKTHLDLKGYRCDMCNLSFSVRSNLRAHLRAYHEGVRFYCSQCTKVFIAKSSLDRHEKIHVGIREFKCDHCTSEFYTKKELSQHQRYHQGLKPYQCEECFKTFFARHHLTVHLRSHSGEKPYVCNVSHCGKSFVDSQKLKRHRTAKHTVAKSSVNLDPIMPLIV